MLSLYEQLKEDNQDAIIQIDKLVKRVRQLQGEQERMETDGREQSEKIASSLDEQQRL